jgi:hypothetical protein
MFGKNYFSASIRLPTSFDAQTPSHNAACESDARNAATA